MINPINSGAVLPFYTESSGALAHSRQVSFNADGWKILGTNTQLLPFIFWQSGAPDVVAKFQVINIDTGKVFDLSTSLIDRRKRADNTKTWYIFDGSDIGTTLPCGTYKIRVEFVFFSVISDEIEVINAPGSEYISLATTICSLGVVTFQATDTIASAVAYERTEYRATDGSSWTTLTPTGSGPYTYELDISAISLSAGENLLIRRTIQTDAGNTLRTLHSLDWTSGSECSTYQLLTISDESTYRNGNLWYLEISDSEDWEDKIYESGFVERIYLRGYWDFPEAEREVEVLVDNAGNRELSTADTREFSKMTFEGVADHLVGILSALGDYETISLKNLARNYAITGIIGAETDFTTEPGQGYYSRGRLRFRSLKHFETACLNGETTSAI